MRHLINLIERAEAQRTVEDLEDYDGDALKDGCTKCIPDEIAHSDFAFVWWVGGTKEEMLAKRAAFMAAEQKMKPAMVKHADMCTGQLCVNPDKVESLMDKPAKSLPVIHHWNGNHILFDGNHRVVADVLLGKDASKCLVCELDEFFNDDGTLKG
jgi:hypothetical protein